MLLNTLTVTVVVGDACLLLNVFSKFIRLSFLEFIKKDDNKLGSQKIVHLLRQILHIFRYLVLIVLISLQLHQPLW